MEHCGRQTFPFALGLEISCLTCVQEKGGVYSERDQNEKQTHKQMYAFPIPAFPTSGHMVRASKILGQQDQHARKDYFKQLLVTENSE